MASPAVEVASVNAHQGELPRTGGTLTISGPRITFRGFSVLGLLWFAYNVRIDQIPTAASLDHTMYDVEILAGGERALTRDEFRPLVQSVLADRFKLEAHSEARPTSVYALVVGKDGPKFKESAPDATPTRELINDGHNSGALVRKSTLADLASQISSNADLDRPVVDATGLTGYYDIRLVYSSQYRITPDTPTAIDIFTAVEKQLGLKLEARTLPFDVLVIDHIEKPSQN